MTLFRTAVMTFFLTLANFAAAQTNINLGAVSVDPAAPLEIASDSLEIDQDTGIAVFRGNVVVGQGDLRLNAGQVRVVYNDASGDITRLSATGGVTFVTATEAAEADSAEYDLGGETLVLSGNVLLSQGQSAISAERMNINLKDGSAVMDGRVRTIFSQGGN